jgi:hypothetical protein
MFVSYEIGNIKSYSPLVVVCSCGWKESTKGRQSYGFLGLLYFLLSLSNPRTSTRYVFLMILIFLALNTEYKFCPIKQRLLPLIIEESQILSRKSDSRIVYVCGRFRFIPYSTMIFNAYFEIGGRRDLISC